jgi:4-hydroxybenzoate polyprenyltransferase
MGILGTLREFAVLIRIQQLGTSVTPVIGALSVKGSALDLTNAFYLFLIAFIINIGGQVHNDLCDYHIDKHSKELKLRPLVRGTFSLRDAKIIILANLILVLALLVLIYPSIYAIPIILIGFFFGTLYNINSKRIPGADIFLSVSLMLFFLFGAIVVTEDFQGFQDISATTWILSFIVFIHVFLMDALGGGLKDAENDRKSGAKTLAVTLGVRANKELFIPLTYWIITLIFELSTIILTIILFGYFQRSYHQLQLILIVLLLIGMLATHLLMITLKVFDRKKIKYINRNHELFGYMLIPMILINSIGIIWFLFLIIFPLAWFIIFNYLLYQDSWRNPKTY